MIYKLDSLQRDFLKKRPCEPQMLENIVVTFLFLLPQLISPSTINPPFNIVKDDKT